MATTARPQQKAKRVARPRRDSLEYRLSWGIEAIKADQAYARGATGAGVTVAFIDTGLSPMAAQLLGRISPQSIDLVERRPGLSSSTHGDQTAGLAAAALDGRRTVGVAYDATILGIRADIEGSCADTCSVQASDLARGIDYAVEQGARIIGVPLIGYRPLPSAEAALERAAKAGVVIVAAAGNDAKAGPAWPASYAGDPRFRGAILVAGASTYDGQLAAWSNRAGQQAEYYLAAPGHNLPVDCDDKVCYLVSGTSYSVSYVSGALALLLDRYPGLSAREAAALLLDGAQDLQPAGADADNGRGLLDVAGALRVAERRQPAVALNR